MLLLVFPAGIAAAFFGLQLPQARSGEGRRKLSLKLVRDRHIASGVTFLLAVVAVAVIGGFASESLPDGISTDVHGAGALLVFVLLAISTALVSLKTLKRLSWSRFVHSLLNGTVLAVLALQFLSGAVILKQLWQVG